MSEFSRDKFIDLYRTKEDNNRFISQEREEIIDEHFRDKNGQEIAKYLTSKTVAETGGLTALSGFYYQFLVTVEYIIEMLEGKWDFVIMEYHDDVVVGKENKIRFIQVKSSQKIKSEVTASPASGLYTRSTKTIKEKSYKQANSWVDKLLSNAALVKTEGYGTEFQLYASYHFIRTPNYNFDHYTDNKYFDKEVPPKDDLLEVLSKKVFDENGIEYSYSSECGEKIENLLERFYLHTGSSLQEIDRFQSYLCVKLNRIIFDGYGENVTFSIPELNSIIGSLFEECTDKNNIEKLIITKEKMEPILNTIRKTALAGASETVNQHDSLTVINSAVEELLTSVEEVKHSEKIKNLIYEYKEYLKFWVKEEKGDIKSLLERLFDGTDRTSIYSNLSQTKKVNSLLDLFTMIVMLIAIKNKKMEFDKNKSLVTTKSEGLESFYSFLRLEAPKKKSKAIVNLETIIKNTTVEEQLYLMELDLNVIIQNYIDRNFNEIENIEIDVTDEIDVEGLEKSKKLNSVPMVAKLLPGNYLFDGFYEALDEENIEKHLSRLL